MDTSLFKCSIYVLIAALTSVSTELANFHSFDEISPMKWWVIGFSVCVQSLVALRAFLDQSISISKDQSSTETPSADNNESIN
jgi:hypothetical protein